MYKRYFVALVGLLALQAACSAQSVNSFSGVWATGAYLKPDDLAGRTFMAVEKLSATRYFVVSYSTFDQVFNFAGYGELDSKGRVVVSTDTKEKLYLYFGRTFRAGEKVILMLAFDGTDESYGYNRVADILK